MQAIQYFENSDEVNVLKCVQIEKPSAKQGEVVVKLKAAAINPIDFKVMGGHLKAAGWSMPLPFTPGYDFAGVVEEVGEGSNFSVGDEVFGVNWGQHKHDDEGQPVGGTLAEYMAIPASKVSKKPEGVSFEQAAAVALVGTTAHDILFKCANVTSGSRVLILGGASAVGAIAIQLAKAKGAWVATTCSTRTMEYTAQFGADKIVNYRESQWDKDKELKDLDAVIDTVAEENSFARVKENGVVKNGGAFVSIASFDAGFDPSAHPSFSFAAFTVLSNSSAVQDELAAMIADGSLKVIIDKTVQFGEDTVRDIFSYQMGGASCGKNVVVF